MSPGDSRANLVKTESGSSKEDGLCRYLDGPLSFRESAGNSSAAVRYRLVFVNGVTSFEIGEIRIKLEDPYRLKWNGFTRFYKYEHMKSSYRSYLIV